MALPGPPYHIMALPGPPYHSMGLPIIAWHSIAEGILVLSNDADTVAKLVLCVEVWKQRGLEELYCLYGTGENRDYLPIHKMHANLGDPMCRVVIKAHVLTGDDALSKIGSKHAALTLEPFKYLSGFAEAEEMNHL